MTGENQVEGTLRGVAARLTVDADLQKDVMQEMVIHLANIGTDRPGQTRSWYIKSCEFQARNYLKRGRSVDSYKRSSQTVSLDEPGQEESRYGFYLMENRDAHDVIDEITARDILDQLQPKLSPLQRQILDLLMLDMGVREVARELKLSHPAVIKHRRKIAHYAEPLLAGLPLPRHD